MDEIKTCKKYYHPLTLSKAAHVIIQTLQEAGFEAYAVGGCIRDQLLGVRPKDFDVATNATPEQIKPLFDRCILIGKRFRLAHVYISRDLIEVATFRGQQDASTATSVQEQQDDASVVTSREEPFALDRQESRETGILMRDNHYGTLEEDAVRRDYTMNALYYNPTTQEILDYCGGMDDIVARRLRLIGDPEIRFREDPVRMLRAVRFSIKLGLPIPPDLLDGIQSSSHLLSHVAAGRMFDEYGKFFLHGFSEKSFDVLRNLALLKYMLPTAAQGSVHPMWRQALRNTDARLQQGKGLNPIFLISVLLWHPFQALKSRWIEEGLDPPTAEVDAANRVIENQVKHTAFPRHMGQMIRDMWQLQRGLEQRRARQLEPTLTHPRFRAGYDLLLLRGEAQEVPREICEFWTEFQLLSPDARAFEIQQAMQAEVRRRRKRR